MKEIFQSHLASVERRDDDDADDNETEVGGPRAASGKVTKGKRRVKSIKCRATKGRRRAANNATAATTAIKKWV